MGLWLSELRPARAASAAAMVVSEPPWEVLGQVNDAAYDCVDVFAPLVSAMQDPRARAHGLVDETGSYRCVAMTLLVDGDVSVCYVATDTPYRRQGLASWLLWTVLAAARDDSATSASLQTSPDGATVYQALGFRQVAVLHGHLRNPAQP